MRSNIGIESVNNIAFNSVNIITSSIKSTLEKGNSLIRSQIYPHKTFQKTISNHKQYNSQLISIDQSINAYELYQSKVKKNIINLLNFAQMKWKQFCDLPIKSGHQYNEYLQKFKKINSKLNANLNNLMQQQNTQDLHTIRIQLKRIIEYLNQRARKYIDKNKQIINLIRKKQHEDFDSQCQQQAIKQQMLDLLDKLKNQAITMGSDLKKDNVVISQIGQKQQKQLNVLSITTTGIQQINNHKSIGFFKLISYAGIALVVWIFTLLFILIF